MAECMDIFHLEGKPGKATRYRRPQGPSSLEGHLPGVAEPHTLRRIHTVNSTSGCILCLFKTHNGIYFLSLFHTVIFFLTGHWVWFSLAALWALES